MKYPSLHTLKISLTAFAFALCLSLQASAACPEPASGHLAICQPSPNSTIYQVPHIEAIANPTSGSITTMKVYIDNKLVLQNGGGSLNLFEGGVANGTHHLVINAWDDFGRLYQASENFGVTGICRLAARSPAWACVSAPQPRDLWSHRIWASPPDSRAIQP